MKSLFIPCWDTTPSLLMHYFSERRDRFTYTHESYSSWVILAPERGRFRFQIGNQSGTCEFGSWILCPPQEDLHREVLEGPLTFHVFYLEWHGEAPTPGLYEMRDTARLRHSYEWLRHTAFDPDATLLKEHLILDWNRLSLWEKYHKRTEHHDALIETVKAQLEAALDKPQSLAKIAAQIGLSPSALTRRFQLAMNTSPSEWLTAIRLERARRLLLETDYTLEVIAARCGFNNAFYLSRVFKRRHQVSPSAFRRQHRI